MRLLLFLGVKAASIIGTKVGCVGHLCQDWMVEVRIPWSAMQGDFVTDVFPPNVGDSVGFSVLGIDYDDAGSTRTREFCSWPSFQTNGVTRVTFQRSASSWYTSLP